jgi:branched-subunit amino acid ABC-type transport system permease component
VATAEQLVYQLMTNVAYLTLSSIGLIIIFGMMGVINMAHGEFMMVGAYVTAALYHKGIPLPVGIAAAGVVVAAFGLAVERVLIRRLYGQLLMSLVVTFGLSLVMSQGFLVLFGASQPGVATPLGSFQSAGFSYSYYQVVLFVTAVALLGMLWWGINKTTMGLRARATIENAQMASVLGVNSTRTYAVTFAVGSGLAGIAGGLLSAVAQVTPTFGEPYTPIAFVTVVLGGGANVVVGLIGSVLTLASVETIVTYKTSVLLGFVALMVTAFVLIRLMPRGLSATYEDAKRRRLSR